MRSSLLCLYRFLLLFYPPAFRRRFAAEMIECAEAAEPSEWALILGDTGVGIMRCWLEGSHHTMTAAEPNAYLALGESPVRSSAFLRGFVLAVALFVSLCYFSHWRAYKECPGTASESAKR
jgi:hypothetical protein